MPLFVVCTFAAVRPNDISFCYEYTTRPPLTEKFTAVVSKFTDIVFCQRGRCGRGGGSYTSIRDGVCSAKESDATLAMNQLMGIVQ